MNDVAKVGLVKFDFLGLKTLTVIQTAVALADADRKARGEAPLDMAAIPLDDVEVYKMISAADVTGVFQLESSGFRDLLKKLKPDCFEDIVAAGALYRPGPIEGGMVDDFVERKHGRKKVEYPHPVLEPILKDTYGVIVYQEQVMQISSTMAGYSLGQADCSVAPWARRRPRHGWGKGLLPGGRRGQDHRCQDRRGRVRPDGEVCGLRLQPQPLGGVRLLTYQTAYLKYHYPVEFFAGLLTCGKDKTDEVVKFIAEARAQGISVLRPDVNESGADFTVVPRKKPSKRRPSRARRRPPSQEEGRAEE